MAWLQKFFKKPQPEVAPKVAITEEEVLPPYIGPSCPFYGFVGCGNFFMESKGNACALTGEHSPCRLEMAGQTPDWDACIVYNHNGNAKSIARLLDSLTVAPEKFWPAGQRSWEGMSLRRWFTYVMNRPFP